MEIDTSSSPSISFAAGSRPREYSPRALFIKLAPLVLALLLLWQGEKMLDKYYGILELPLTEGEETLKGADFPAFYAGAELLLTDPGQAYDDDAQSRAIQIARGYAPEQVNLDSPWDRYYNPPVYSLILSPLTLLDIRTAYAVSLLVNLVGLGLLLYALRLILAGRSILFLCLTGAVVTSLPVNYAFWHSQPTLFLAGSMALAFHSLEKGANFKAGALWALMAVKPHLLLIQGLVFPFWNRPLLRGFSVVMALMLAPFLLLGPGGIIDYADLLLGRGTGDVADSSFSEAVLGWSGFLRGLTGEANPRGTLIMVCVSLTLFFLIRRRGDSSLLPLAASVTVLVIVPHSHPQDWVMVVPGAAFLLRSHRSLSFLVISTSLLLLVYFGLHNWAGLSRTYEAFYWPTFGAFCLLVWLYLLGELRARHGAESPDLAVE